MKILVTGAAGYIGSHTLVDLIDNGFDVVSVDNLSNSFESALQGVEKITGKKVKHYTVDLLNIDGLCQIFEENLFEGIIHFAAKKYVNESVEKPLEYYENNVVGLLNVLKCCKEFKVQNFVFSSSCSVYGNAEKLPVDESCPLAKSESPYAETKVMGERILQDFAKDYPIKITLLRYFNPAGAHPSGLIGEKPKQEPQNIVPRITGTALGKYKEFLIAGKDYPTKDGTCVRDYIHVCDIAHAHTLAVQWLSKQTENHLVEIFNLGTGNGVSVLEMVNAFEQANELSLNYGFSERRQGDVVAIYADNTKAKNRLKWNTKYSIQDMMKSAFAWDKKLK